MARKRVGQPESFVDLGFPLEGVDESRRFGLNMRGHAADGQNVRAYEPATGRARGGSRAGLSKYMPDTVDGDFSATPSPVQCIDHIVATVIDPAAGYGQIAIGRRTTAGTASFSLLSATDGTGYATANGAGNQAGACCWDSSSTLYSASRDTTTSLVRIEATSVAGELLWKTLPFTVDGAGEGVLGMRVSGGVLYVYARAFTGQSRLYRYDTATGDDIGVNPWKTESADSLVDHVSAFGGGNDAIGNCMAIAGGVLALFVNTAATTVKLQLWRIADGVLIATTTVATDASAATALDIAAVAASDSFLVLWTTTTTPTNKLRNYYKDGSTVIFTVDCTGVSGVCVDALSFRGGAAGTDVFGTGFSFSTFSLTTGAAVASQDAGATTAWDKVDSDGSGGFVLTRDNGTDIEYMRLDADLAQDWIITGNSTFVDPPHYFAVNNSAENNPDERLAIREIRALAIAGGTLRIFSSAGVDEVEPTDSGNAFSIAAPVIFSTQFGEDMFFADGVSAKYYDTSTNSVVAWTPTAGSLPIDDRGHRAKLICTWRARIVVSGLRYDSQNWFMSRVNDAFDWDYSPESPGPTDAVAGNNSPAGKIGDIVNCIFPFNDDVLIFGGDHTIWLMRGDPLAGGAVDLVTDTIGIAFGEPICKGPDGTVYFFGSRGGIYRMVPGQQPVRASQQIDERLRAVNMDENIVRLAWDERAQGLHVFITPLDRTAAAEHYFWESRTNAWWPDVFAEKNHNPKAVHVFDGDDPDDRVLLIGSWDGYIRQVDYEATTDDGEEIESFVVMGPILTKDLDDVLFKDVQAVLGEQSGDVTYAVHVGNTAEAALSSTPVLTGTWTAGRNLNALIRRAGYAIYLKISSTNRWAFESARFRLAVQGGVRRRGR